MASGFASQEADRNIGDVKPTLARIVFPDPDQLLSALRRFLQRSGAWRNFERDWPLESREFAASGFALPRRFGCARAGNATSIESATTVATPVRLMVITNSPGIYSNRGLRTAYDLC